MINARQDFDQTFTDFNHINKAYTIPSSPNFPFNASVKTRYVIELDECIYTDDTHQFSISGYTIDTGKAPTTTHKYWITPITSSLTQAAPIFPYLVEFAPANSGESVTIDYYGVGSPLTDTNLNLASVIPIGTISAYGGGTSPAGWLLCNGTAYSRSTYSALFNILTESKGTCTISIEASAIVTLSNHQFITGRCIELTTTGALPTGLSINTNYYVIYIDSSTFYLATSFENALAGTKIGTSGTQSGTHTLRHCPFGISGASDFKVPDGIGASLAGTGTSSGYTENEVIVFGQKHNDRFQGHSVANKTGFVSDSAGVGGASGTAYSGGTFGIQTDGSNGTPRIGNTTRGKLLGVNFIIKY